MRTRQLTNHLDASRRDIPRVDAAHTTSLMMHKQHDARGVLFILMKNLLQHMHHEFHWGVVIVEQNYLVQRGRRKPCGLMIQHRFTLILGCQSHIKKQNNHMPMKAPPDGLRSGPYTANLISGTKSGLFIIKHPINRIISQEKKGFLAK